MNVDKDSEKSAWSFKGGFYAYAITCMPINTKISAGQCIYNVKLRINFLHQIFLFFEKKN